MIFTEHQATIFLQDLMSPLIEVPDTWNPLNAEDNDKYILQWIKHPDNDWDKKDEFDKLVKLDKYAPGQYAWVVLYILGYKVYGRE